MSNEQIVLTREDVAKVHEVFSLLCIPHVNIVLAIGDVSFIITALEHIINTAPKLSTFDDNRLRSLIAYFKAHVTT